MKIFTTAIRSLSGQQSFPCNLVRLGGQARDSEGRLWIKAEIFAGLGSPELLLVDANTLFIDRNCTVQVLAKIIH